MTAYLFDEMLERELRHVLKQADPVYLEDAIRFLEDDPTTLGSGYLKEIIWKQIKHYDLLPEQMTRLEKAALAYLERPMCREFKRMCQTMSRIAPQDFWRTVAAQLDSDNPCVQVNAYCLYAYAGGIDAGEKKRLELKHYTWRLDPVPSLKEILSSFYFVDILLALLVEPENWPNGEVVRQPADPRDLPLISYNPTRDQEFSTLAMSACYADVLIPKLHVVLRNGLLFGSTGWLYTIYLLQKLNDPRAVPILIEFLEQQVAWKRFDSVSKSELIRVSLKVLRHYATPEALEVVSRYGEQDKKYLDWYKDRPNGGWLMSYP